MTFTKAFFTEEDIFYRRLVKLKRSLKVIALSKLTIDCLDKMEIPKSKVRYRETNKTYTNKKSETINFSYTLANITYNNKKRSLSKTKNADRIMSGMNNLQLQYLLELRTETQMNLNCNLQNAAMYCNSLNSLPKHINTYYFNVEDEITKACMELEASNEYSRIINDLYNVSQKEEEEIEYSNSWRETQKNTFNNKIIDLYGEKYRSKNEVIASVCADNCGLFINPEPFYPGTKLRADFGLMCASASQDKQGRFIIKEKYVEILGKCGDEAYDTKTKLKQNTARKLGIPILFINMTDEQNETGTTLSRFDMRKIENILIDFYLNKNIIENKICLPY